MDNFQLVYELNRAATALNSHIDARIVPHAGITRAQFVALVIVGETPNITKAELSRTLGSSHVAAGRLVTILIEKGLVILTPNKRNAHTAHLHITRAGKDMIEHVRIGLGKISAELFGRTETNIDVATLAAQLRELAEILSSHK